MAPLLSNLLVVVKSLVNTALLLAATLILGLSPLGFLTVPGLGKAITVMHIPVILAATLVSPVAAGVVGAAFGLLAGLKYQVPPLIYHVVARVLAGLVGGLTFQAISRAADEGSKVTKASLATAVTTTAANTIFMSAAFFLLQLADPAELFSVAFVHGVIELTIALIITTPVTIALKARNP